MNFHEEDQEEVHEEVGGDEDEDDDVDAVRTTTYESYRSNPNRLAEQATEAATGWGGGGQPAMMIRYKECRKNHAVGIGKHAVDGCGEFLPSGPDGTLDALVCAACTCHRNFHRMCQLPPPPSWYHSQLRVGPTPPRPLDNSNNNNNKSNAGVGSSGKRRRTKFTEEQRERMLGMAEKLGWRMQKHDEAEVERFCSETGVGRQVLRVWINNNKHTLGKKP